MLNLLYRMSFFFPFKFALKVNRKSDGCIIRYKLYLDLLNHLGNPRTDCNETYAWVPNVTVVRVT